MRRLELTWDGGAWPAEVAQMIVDDILHALDHPLYQNYPWVRPDSVRMISEGDPVYPDGLMRLRDGVLVGDTEEGL